VKHKILRTSANEGIGTPEIARCLHVLRHIWFEKDVMMLLNSPSTQLVEKKAMLRVSRGLSWVQSGDLVWGSDSPVRDELSTWTQQDQTI